MSKRHRGARFAEQTHPAPAALAASAGGMGAVAAPAETEEEVKKRGQKLNSALEHKAGDAVVLPLITPGTAREKEGVRGRPPAALTRRATAAQPLAAAAPNSSPQDPRHCKVRSWSAMDRRPVH